MQCFFSCAFCLPTIEGKERPDTLPYYTKYPNLLTARVFGTSKENKFNFYNRKGHEELWYTANDDFNVGVAAAYKWLGIGIAFNARGINNDENILGRTEKFDIQLNSYTGKFVIDGHFTYYAGYYLGKKEDYDLEDTNLVVTKRPDIKSFSTGASMFYVVDHEKYSYKASFVQTEWQAKKSGFFFGRRICLPVWAGGRLYPCYRFIARHILDFRQWKAICCPYVRAFFWV
ncbi:MAG: DUF4421 domain-containing protein [Bacteroidales bacterium]|nr:DUF4421 domain-containing protein [Bacteroidales bacterium]